MFSPPSGIERYQLRVTSVLCILHVDYSTNSWETFKVRFNLQRYLADPHVMHALMRLNFVFVTVPKTLSHRKDYYLFLFGCARGSSFFLSLVAFNAVYSSPNALRIKHADRGWMKTLCHGPFFFYPPRASFLIEAIRRLLCTPRWRQPREVPDGWCLLENKNARNKRGWNRIYEPFFKRRKRATGRCWPQ